MITHEELHTPPNKGNALQAAIDDGPLRPVQLRVIVLCALVALIDGFDAQAIAFAAPGIVGDFDYTPAQMGRLFAAALVGLMIGAFAMGPVSDRFGRKPVIVISCLAMGVFSLCVAYATSLEQLMLFRFLTGLGLGGAMPNVNVLTSEYSPARSRAFLMTLMFVGFPLGAVLGGFASVALIAEFGWRSVFVVGGGAPILLALVLIRYLPESPHILTRGKASSKRLRELTEQLGASIQVLRDTGTPDQPSGGARKPGLAELLRGRVFLTLAIWFVFLINLLIVYTLMNWLPSVMNEAGLTLENAIFTSVVFNAGGVIGGLAIARLIDLGGEKQILTVVFALGACSTTLVAPSVSFIPALFLVIFFAGAAFLGSQFGLNALVVKLYPDEVRATGLAWALAVGRIGAIIGPIATGEFIARQWSLLSVFLTIATLSVICAAIMAAVPLRVESAVGPAPAPRR